MNRLKQGIILISYGCRSESINSQYILPIKNMISKQFPEFVLYNAYLSDFMRQKIYETDKIEILSPKDAILQMIREGITDIILQPLLIFPGNEYKKIQDLVESLDKKINIVLSNPLIYEVKHGSEVAIAFKTILPNVNSHEAILLVPHGSKYKNEELLGFYKMLKQCFYKEGMDTYIFPLIDQVTQRLVINQLKAKKFKTIFLVPLMLTAGVHVTYDMAGNHKISMKSVLENEGFEVNCNIEGLARHEVFRNMFVKRLKDTLSKKTKVRYLKRLE